jgi:hypothetical protein
MARSFFICLNVSGYLSLIDEGNMLVSRCLASVVLLGLLTGCGGKSGPVTATVSGTVTLDGVPLEDAVVNFTVDGFVGSGKTGSDGSYSLVTGAALGENKVWIENFKAPEGFSNDPEGGMDVGQLEAMNEGEADAGRKVETGSQIPEEYSDSETTILTVSVSEGGTSSADFGLKSATEE